MTEGRLAVSRAATATHTKCHAQKDQVQVEETTSAAAFAGGSVAGVVPELVEYME